MKGKIKDSKGQVVNWQYDGSVIRINLHPLRYTNIKCAKLINPKQIIKTLDTYIGVTEVIE